MTSQADQENPFIRQFAMVGARNMTLVAVVLAAVYLFTGWAVVLLVCLAVAGLAAGEWLTSIGIVGRWKPLISFGVLAAAAFTLVNGPWTVIFLAVGVFMGLATFSQKNSGL